MALLLREGLALYGFSHPALLPVLGVSIEDRSAPFLLYPHTGYRNMKRFLLRCKLSSEGPPRALTTQEVVEMALQAAKGVQYLHKKRLVHRDLAARNCVYVKIINYLFVISICFFPLQKYTCTLLLTIYFILRLRDLILCAL